MRCCFAHVQVGAWLPLMLVGVELAVRAQDWRGRVTAWALAGFALSQILAGWLGQGAYYALLLLALFTLYRTVVQPPRPLAGLRRRLLALVLNGAAVTFIGFVLAAAGIVPRLDYHARSNLAVGYAGNPNLAWVADPGAWPWRHTAELLFGRGGWYVGGAVIVLALVAPLIAGKRFAAPLLTMILLLGITMTTEPRTPLHDLAYSLLPMFEDLHRHRPERVLVVWYLAVALLAGIALSALPRWRCRPIRLALLTAIPLTLTVGLIAAGVPVPIPTRVVLLGSALALALWPWLPSAVSHSLLFLLAAVVVGDATLAARDNTATGLYTRVDLGAYDRDAGVAPTLRALTGNGAGRYFGYDPALQTMLEGQAMLYRHDYRDPRTTALLVNNRATLRGLPDLQGYNPLQPERYVEFMTALNGHPQEYHGAYVFERGLDSPLLPLLNARYIVIPAKIPPGRADLQGLVERYPTVDASNVARLLENPDVLPRAWIVHDARQLPYGDALSALASGSVDPLRTVLLESAPPPLAAPRDPAADAARIVSYAPNRMELRTRTDAPGLLVLSEGYDPGWRAEIDGEPAPVLVANHALRAVSLPAGEHTVRLRYAPPALRWGIAISLGGYLTLGILLVTFRLGPRLHPAGRRALVSLSPRDRAIGHDSGAIEVGRDDSVVTRHHRSSSAPYPHPRHGQNTNRGATQHATPSIGTLPVSSSRSDHADHDRTARRDRPAPLRP
ncbi:MAG: YfhO family protein [Chloroflexia bacterium]|nr:YfhO family protein [Chloroflexia bacterium]